MTLSAGQKAILNRMFGGWGRRLALGDLLAAVEAENLTGVADGDITTAKLGADAVTGAKVADGAIDTEHLAAEAVTAAKVEDGAITEAKIGTGAVTATKIGSNAVTTAKIADANVTEAKVAATTASTLGVKRVLLGVLDATAGKAIGTHTIAAQLPSKSILQRLDYEVITTCTSATDAATIALQLQSADDCVEAVAISDSGNPWDAGVPVATKVDGETENWIKCTAARTLSAVIAEEALTAGVIRVYGEFVASV